jgi:hypothetical protein
MNIIIGNINDDHLYRDTEYSWHDYIQSYNLKATRRFENLRCALEVCLNSTQSVKELLGWVRESSLGSGDLWGVRQVMTQLPPCLFLEILN